jgi:hypothetical protein
MTPKQIAASLSQAERDYLIGRYSMTTTRGLIQRKLLAYRWGNDPSFGYSITPLGQKVCAIILKEQIP